jgi:hypothetical protein
MIAIAAAVKPYAAAWFLPLIGLSGSAGVLIIGFVSAVAWAPVWAWWGIDSYLGSARNVEELRAWLRVHGNPRLAFDVPVLRYIVPFVAVAASLVARTWRSAVLLGSLAYVAYFLFAPWNHTGYWVVLVPVVGVALEIAKGGEATEKAPSKIKAPVSP